MRHVDDGILHAYLDGAIDALADAGELPDGASADDVRVHLDSCADCRARLDDARAVRERAGLVLADVAGSPVDVPPYETVVGAAPSRRRPMRLPLAWAASMMLALGAGWWGSELWRTGEARVAVESLADTTPPAAAADTEAGASEPQASPGMAEAPAAAEPDVAVAASARADAVASVADGDRPTETTRVSPDAGPPAAAPPPAAPPPAAPPAARDAGVAASMGDPTVADATRARAESFEAPALKVAASDSATAAGAQAFRRHVAAVRSEDAAWRPLDPGDVDSLDTVLVIDDAGAATFAVTGPSLGMSELVRVRQRLHDGAEVELMIGRPVSLMLESLVVTGAPAAAAQRAAPQRLVPPPPTVRAAEAGAAADEAGAGRRVDVLSSELLDGGMAEAVVRLPDSDTYVVIRGAFPPHELARLAQRLVAPRRDR
jgi:hypothetical protein